MSPRVSKPARQLSSRFTPSRLSRAPASSTSPPVNTPDQSKTPVARLASDRGMNSGGKLLGSPAQRTPGLQGGRSVGKTGTRELRQLTGAPKLLGQGTVLLSQQLGLVSPGLCSQCSVCTLVLYESHTRLYGFERLLWVNPRSSIIANAIRSSVELRHSTLKPPCIHAINRPSSASLEVHCWRPTSSLKGNLLVRFYFHKEK